MSTRSQIIIKDERDEQWFYRHSDGYPSGNMPSLFKLMQWYDEGKIRKNVEQSCGWLVLIGADEYGYVYDYKSEKQTRKKTLTSPSKKDSISGWKYGAYEICPKKEKHGDIEWLYTIDIVSNTIVIEAIYSGQTRNLTFAEMKAYSKNWDDLEKEFIEWMKSRRNFILSIRGCDVLFAWTKSMGKRLQLRRYKSTETTVLRR